MLPQNFSIWFFLCVLPARHLVDWARLICGRPENQGSIPWRRINIYLLHRRVQTVPSDHLSSCAMATGCHSGGRAAGACCWPTTPIQRIGLRNSRAMILLPFCAFVASYMVNFNFWRFWRSWYSLRKHLSLIYNLKSLPLSLIYTFLCYITAISFYSF